jgi:hypothetical protein
MQRNMDLIHLILVSLESMPEACHSNLPVVLSLPAGYTDEEISYHVELLKDAGLIEATTVPGSLGDPKVWFPCRLTWAGHEHLEKTRSYSAGAR